MTKLQFTGLSLVLLICLLMSCTRHANSQSETHSNNIFISGDFRSVQLDKLNGIFLVSDQNDLIKYDQQGKELFRYANKRFGDISSLDVSNPQKLLVYYGDFQTAVILDNTLSEIQIIYFDQLDIWNPQAIAMSNDNALWYFDQNQKILRKITYQGDELLSSNTLLNEGLDQVSITEMTEINQNVYLNTVDDGILQFDNFGQFIKQIKEVACQSFQLINSNIIFLNDKGQMFVYKDVIEGPQALFFEKEFDKKIHDFYVVESHLYGLMAAGLVKQNIKE